MVNNLGVCFDSELLIERQVSRLCQVCYFHLRRLRTVRRSLTKESLLTLVHAFVTSRIDHCNGVLYGSSAYLLDRLQSVLNSAARLILNVPKFSRISSAIRNELLCTGCRSRGVYVTRSLFLSGTASPGWHRSTRWRCAVRWACLPADNPSGPSLVVTLSFQDTDSKGRATGPSQFLVLKFGTHFRSKLDGHPTI